MRTGLAEASNVYPRRIDATAESGTWMHRHHLAPMAIVALLLLVAAACSGGQDSSSSTVAPPDADNTETEADEGHTTSGSDTDAGKADAGDVPGPPTVEAVRFPSGDLQLEGDLHLPTTPGPHPAVVLIHGSGPINRQSVLNGQLALQFGFGIPSSTDWPGRWPTPAGSC